MIKKSFVLLLFMLLFSACAERGSNLPLTHQTATAKKVKTEDTYIPTLVLKNPKENTIYNNFSGSVILLIGLVLLL